MSRSGSSRRSWFRPPPIRRARSSLRWRWPCSSSPSSGRCKAGFKARMPGLLALAITMTVTVAACLAFASLVVMGLWPGRACRSLADSARYQALYDERDRLARGPRNFGRGLVERAFQRRLAPALGEPDHRPRQHHPELLADRPRLRHSGIDGGRGPSPAGRDPSRARKPPGSSWRQARRRRGKSASTWRCGR